VLSLDREPDELLAALHKTRAQQIRRAEREGIVVERGCFRADLSEVFYRLHVATRRRLGVPVQPRRFFMLLWERMLEPGRGFVLTARRGKTAIASAVFLSLGGRVTYKFSASDRSPFGAPDAILWTAILQSSRDGARVLDFGRTATGNVGLRQFKLWWGTREEPLTYTVFASHAPTAAKGRAAAALAPMIRRAPPWVAQGLGAFAYRFTA
jgi:lipid II:glycine glycyltransferase (peptidoglycan interpeptide bridge formation enzyme)